MAWDNLLSAAADLYKFTAGNKAVKKYNVPTAAEKQSQALYAALADPNSPLMQQYTQEAKNSNMADFLAQLRAMQGADRTQQAMGRSTTFFNPERADEATSFLTSRGLPQMNQLATQQAQQRLLQAASGIENAQKPQQERLNVAGGNALSNAAFVPDAIMRAFGQQPQQGMTRYSNLPAAQAFGQINWNQPSQPAYSQYNPFANNSYNPNKMVYPQ